MRKLSASILSSDFTALGTQIKSVEQAGADWIHVDVMDGHFVPNITMGPQVVRAIKRSASIPLDVHLMVEAPEKFLEVFAEAGADRIGVHVEAAAHLHRTVQRIKALGKKATVTLNPATSLSTLEYILQDVDMVLLMTVNPGFSGQEFISAVVPKIRQLRTRIDRLGLPVLIQVDGGIHLDTIGEAVAAGADVVVASSAIFNDKDIKGNVSALKEKMQ